ncbi:MAG: L-threonylcarbamoyladenylate synthase [Candidatus Gracilibacteria bacterium]
MEIIQIREPFGHSYHRILEEVRPELLKGGVLMYGTDTCWGLSTMISSKKGIEKIYNIKNRPETKAVSIAVSDLQMAHQYVHISQEVESFMKKYLPGRISLILPAKMEAFPTDFLIPDRKVSIRIPSDLFTRRLVASLKEPLTTTSANISGQKELYTWKEVEHFLENISEKPDLVLYKKRIPKCLPSTIINTTTTPWTVVRQGGFVLEK